MNAKKLYALIGAAALALIAAVWVNNANKPVSEPSEQSKPLLPDFRGQINEINAITLTGAENKVIATLTRGDRGWVILEKSNYPADLAKLREFLLKLADATLLEPKTSNPKHYAELGIEDIKDKDAKGVLVTLAGLKEPIKLIIGNYNGAGGGGTFVRRAGEAQSWLAKGNLSVDKTAADWEQRDIADIASVRLKQVILTAQDGKVLRVYKDQSTDANFKVADVPKGRELSSEFVANALGSALSGLRADDVETAQNAPPGEKVSKASYLAFDGLAIDVTAWEKDSKHYAQFVAKLDATQADTQIKADQAKAKADYDQRMIEANKKVAEEKKVDAKNDAAARAASDVAKPLGVSDPAKDNEEHLAALNKEVDALNKTFVGWTFVLPAYKAASFTKTMDDMLKPLEEKKSEAKKGSEKPASKPPVSVAKPAGK